MTLTTSLLRLLPILLLGALGPVASIAADGGLTLAIGDPARRDRQVEVEAGTLVDARRGERLAPAALAGRLANARLVFIGEDHTSMDAHRVQLEVIRELHRAGRRVVVALEMYPWTHQQSLDEWVAGRYTDDEFLDESDWYEVWGYRWEYYRDIFHFAREEKLPLVAINAPRELVRAMRESGPGALPLAERDRLPPRIDLDSAEHRRLFETYLGLESGSHGAVSAGSPAFEGMFRAQCLWDAVMGWNALRAVRQRPGADTVVVVLLGTGHVAYGLGATRQIAGEIPSEAIATVIPVASGAGTAVQASFADFIWGIPESGAPLFPELGLSLAGSVGGARGPAANQIIRIAPGSPAARAELRVGDRLLSINGAPVRGAADVRRGLAGTRWGDRLKLRLGGKDDDATREVAVDLTQPAAPRSQEPPHASPPAP